MPINSFENYPLTWKPERDTLEKPLYLSIANRLEEDIVTGKLLPHTKLPPQRELADFLDINLSTVTRAFKVCELKGLIYGTTGKGTFVAANTNLPNVVTNHESTAKYIELGVIKPFYQLNSLVMNLMPSVLNKSYANTLLEYSYPLGTEYQLQAAQQWLAYFHMDVATDNLVITSGAQNALTIALVSLFKPGDKIVTDLYTHPNFKNLASLLNIQLVPVASDEYGMVPESLDAVCKTNGIKGIYLMPSYSNPTNTTMHAERRADIAKIIVKHAMILIEDDVYAFLLREKIPPVSALIPEQSIYICGTSKSLCAGLRVAFVALPTTLRARYVNGIYNINLKTPALNVEIISDLIYSGTAVKIIEQKLELVQQRNQVYYQYFPSEQTPMDTMCFSQWLAIDSRIPGHQFEELAKKRGIRVFCSDRFAVGNEEGRSFLRIAVSSPDDVQSLESGLQILQELLDNQYIIDEKADFIV